MAKRWGNNRNSERLYFLGLQNHRRGCLQQWNEKMLAPWKKSYDKPRQDVKKQRHYFANKDLSSQNYGFSSSHAWMLELDHKEIWVPRNWCFQIVVLEKALESPLDSKEIKPMNLEGNQAWIFIGRTDAEAEATWCKELTHWKRSRCWERLRAGGEGGDRGWDGWMASMTQWTWMWANSRRSWRTGSLVRWGLKELDMTEWTATKALESRGTDFGFLVWHRRSLEVATVS